MLETVLAISGKSGLFRLTSRASRGLIVESLDGTHKRMPIFATDKVISLADIAMYTDTEEVPLRQVLKNIQEKEGGKAIGFDVKSADRQTLSDYLGQVLPNFDRDRVYPADMRKLFLWYNILVQNELTDFEEPAQAETPAAETSAE